MEWKLMLLTMPIPIAPFIISYFLIKFLESLEDD